MNATAPERRDPSLLDPSLLEDWRMARLRIVDLLRMLRAPPFDGAVFAPVDGAFHLQGDVWLASDGFVRHCLSDPQRFEAPTGSAFQRMRLDSRDWRRTAEAWIADGGAPTAENLLVAIWRLERRGERSEPGESAFADDYRRLIA